LGTPGALQASLQRADRAVRERVTAARVGQAERFKGTRLLANADKGPAEVRRHCQRDGAVKHTIYDGIAFCLFVLLGQSPDAR
jgi:hypothetical protein